MNLPEIQHTNIARYLDRAEIIEDTARQIMKDFGMFGVEIAFPQNMENAYEELLEQLSFQVEKLLATNHDLLMSVLYQVDITDREIARAERLLPHYNHIELIAHQIIFRDLKKVLFRRYFSAQK